MGVENTAEAVQEAHEEAWDEHEKKKADEKEKPSAETKKKRTKKHGNKPTGNDAQHVKQVVEAGIKTVEKMLEKAKKETEDLVEGINLNTNGVPGRLSQAQKRVTALNDRVKAMESELGTINEAIERLFDHIGINTDHIPLEELELQIDA